MAVNGKIRLLGIAPGAGAVVDVRDCVAVAASARYCNLVPSGAAIIPMTPVSAAMAAIAAALQRGDVAVLASGDPLFFGIGRLLIERFGRERVAVRPALSSMQILAARLGVVWQDAAFVSLHGRPLATAITRLLAVGNTFVLTDGLNTPAAIAAAILARLQCCGCAGLAPRFRLSVGENLNLENERISRLSLAATALGEFAPLNLMLVEFDRPGRLETVPAEAEIHHSRGLITKDEVRAVTVFRLDPPESGVLWDVGAGSGSIGLTAALCRPHLAVFALERRPEQLVNIKNNCRTFLALNLIPVLGEAMVTAQDLPDPDRVFIGGSHGKLAELIAMAHARLKPGGRLVVNVVLPESAELALNTMRGLELTPQSATITVNRGQHGARQELNPITIITGIK